MDNNPLPFGRRRPLSTAAGNPGEPQAIEPPPQPSRRFAESFLLRGERVSEDGDFARAASLFERAALTFETTGDPILAADAYMEQGLALLYLRRGDDLRALEPRIARLLSFPMPGNLLLIRVFLAILRKANEQPGPFVDLVHRRRCLRSHSAAKRPEVISTAVETA